MIEKISQLRSLRFIASKIPGLLSFYHYLLAFLGALRYGFPSRKMVVIGVTGTKGKTTTCNIIAELLEHAGHKTGMATTVNFRIGGREWINTTKQTMLGRFGLQKILKEMADEGCEYAVVETSSEGILQYRHRFVDYDVVVFTNISPEHIDRHGSFDNYRSAKVRLFEQVSKKPDGMGVYNLDDPNAKYFTDIPMSAQYGFYMKNQNFPDSLRSLKIENVALTEKGTEFVLAGERYEMPLLGEFNVYNAAAAICVAVSRLVPLEKIKSALKKIRPTPGRLEVIDAPRNIKVIVDYAHEPASLEAVYGAAKLFKPKHIIGILGSQGGGRDKWKRAAMGQIAASHCDTLILTNEDPYDESPALIVNDVEKGTWEEQKKKKLEVLKILDRRRAIQKTIEIAKPGDVVVITGKGGEVWMCIEEGKKIPWNDRAIVEESISSLESKE